MVPDPLPARPTAAYHSVMPARLAVLFFFVANLTTICAQDSTIAPAPPSQVEPTPDHTSPAAQKASAVPEKETGSAAGLRNFAPGVRIDWKRKAVEVDAKVVLTEGPLELVLCTAGSKEHESILATSARPRDIFQALGLVGLEPGKPVRWDESGKNLVPTEGQKVGITVHYQANGRDESVAVEKWLMTADEKPIETRLIWVFSGSRVMEEGRFGADVEGTVVCVVDFDTALISVGGLHSADDEQLWLRANPRTIPARGTKCKLVITAAAEDSVPTRQP